MKIFTSVLLFLIKFKKNKTFKCEECGRTFPKENDDEALKEIEDNGWSNIPMDEMAVVCDDCYHKIMAQINN